MPSQTWEILEQAQLDGTAITAAAATSMIPAASKYTLPANFFDSTKKLLRITASGRISSVITTPGTARFDVRFGSTVVFDSLAILLDSVAAHTDVGWYLEILLSCRAIGASANLIGQGKWVCEDILGTPASQPKAAAVAILPWASAPAVGSNFDSTAAQVVDVQFTQTVTTGSLKLHQYMLEASR